MKVPFLGDKIWFTIEESIKQNHLKNKFNQNPRHGPPQVPQVPQIQNSLGIYALIPIVMSWTWPRSQKMVTIKSLRPLIQVTPIHHLKPLLPRSVVRGRTWTHQSHLANQRKRTGKLLQLLVFHLCVKSQRWKKTCKGDQPGLQLNCKWLFYFGRKTVEKPGDIEGFRDPKLERD